MLTIHSLLAILDTLDLGDNAPERCVAMLLSDGPKTPSELAKRLGVYPAQISRWLAALRAVKGDGGLPVLSMVVDDNDRRRFQVSLTVAGIAWLAKVQQERAERLQEKVNELPDGVRSGLLAVAARESATHETVHTAL